MYSFKMEIEKNKSCYYIKMVMSNEEQFNGLKTIMNMVFEKTESEEMKKYCYNFLIKMPESFNLGGDFIPVESRLMIFEQKSDISMIKKIMKEYLDLNKEEYIDNEKFFNFATNNFLMIGNIEHCSMYENLK